MPYRELKQAIGDSQLATLLSDDPNAGLLQAAGGSPTASAINAELLVNPGSGYADAGTMDFAPAAALDGAIGPADTVISYRDGVDLDLATVGSLASIEDEIVKLTAIDTGAATMTFGRGCVDTIPAAHADGAAIVFFDDYWASDQVTAHGRRHRRAPRC